ncbi:bacteriophage protein [Burkholderia multivorans ATCC 17616]|uniref:Bacteriophage protein n=1 Tax=Burkholderia multivorans (strain ATCC 17616 / 249) TaxID=395019 RepID=A0A0H3KVY4_BURM1|nr:gp31 [Burkholderia phage Bcep176]ABA60032.1 gp31 [Burkholderia phage Bcep176]BAG46519.1 bacteriophage protein [Burkholderia multivorans ATCC 17616]
MRLPFLGPAFSLSMKESPTNQRKEK